MSHASQKRRAGPHKPRTPERKENPVPDPATTHGEPRHSKQPTANAALSDTERDTVTERLKSAGFAIVRTAGNEEALMTAACHLGHAIGARSFGYLYLWAAGSAHWLGRHTESLTDSPEPLRYFALGCLIPATTGGTTHLHDGSHAARHLTRTSPGFRDVRIRYRSAHRPQVCEHPLIAKHAQFGEVLRFRSANEHNTVTAKPAGLDETELYAAVEQTLDESPGYAHSWNPGDLLIVDNHKMLHSRAPFTGLRHMLRVRYDDPLHQTVTLGG